MTARHWDRFVPHKPINLPPEVPKSTKVKFLEAIAKGLGVASSALDGALHGLAITMIQSKEPIDATP